MAPVDLSTLGGVAGAATIVCPLVTKYVKQIFTTKKARALVSPLIGLFVTTGLALATGLDIASAAVLGLGGLAGGSAGSTARDFLKFASEGE